MDTDHGLDLGGHRRPYRGSDSAIGTAGVDSEIALIAALEIWRWNDGFHPCYWSFEVSIPSGTRLSARVNDDHIAAQHLDIVLVGMTGTGTGGSGTGGVAMSRVFTGM